MIISLLNNSPSNDTQIGAGARSNNPAMTVQGSTTANSRYRQCLLREQRLIQVGLC